MLEITSNSKSSLSKYLFLSCSERCSILSFNLSFEVSIRCSEAVFLNGVSKSGKT